MIENNLLEGAALTPGFELTDTGPPLAQSRLFSTLSKSTYVDISTEDSVLHLDPQKLRFVHGQSQGIMVTFLFI